MNNDFSNLINAYKETLKDEKLYSDTRSTYWKKKYKQNDKFFDLKNLENFRNNQILSVGCDDSINLQNKLNLLECLEHFDDSYLKQNLPEQNIGNCNYSENFLGYYLDYSLVHHLKWYEKIEKYIKDNSNILEIGGGFGSLARIIIKNKNIKYFLIDLPEANLLSNYYLQNHFPNKKIFNYSDFKKYKIEEEIKNFDIFILPPNVLDKKNIFFDFIINTRSFMEMEKKTISGYFNLIQTKINDNGYFLNINRYLKSVVDDDIYFHEYPYDDLWDTIISEKSFLQDRVHFLLTIRKKNIGNIHNEIKKIKENKNIYIKYYVNRHIKRGIYLILAKLFLFTFGKYKLKKISKVLYNLSLK